MKTKVILIEDDTEYIRETESVLNHSNIAEVVGAYCSIEDALYHINGHECIDVALVDIGLPGIDGIAGTKEILKVNPDIRVAMLTVYDDSERVFNAIKNGASGYLLKGEGGERLLKAIEEIEKGGSYFTPSVAQMVLSFFKRKPLFRKKISITPREQEILVLMSEGLAKKQIANQLGIKYNTVDSHIKNIYKKLHVRCGVQAVIEAYKDGII